MSRPEFKPKPGQVDFTHARYCPTLNCVVRESEEILIAKRPSNISFYPGLWNGISGFLDDSKSLEEKILEELSEELGLNEKSVQKIQLGDVHEVHAPEYAKVWIVHPAIASVNTRQTQLNWENEEIRWIKPTELSRYECVPGFEKMAEILLQKYPQPNQQK